MALLAHRTILTVVRETGIARSRAAKMIRAIRSAMAEDAPSPFSGACEADETFIGGQRKNKRLHIRRRPSKHGHGTEKIPIVGVLSRLSGQVAVRVLTCRSEETVIGFMASRLSKEAVLYTDGYKMNRAVRKRGVRHEYVNHHLGEYVRGAVHTNGIEGFWGILKRKMGCIGGMRPARFHVFVGEIVWRFNHRKMPIAKQRKRLLHLVFQK